MAELIDNSLAARRGEVIGAAMMLCQRLALFELDVPTPVQDAADTLRRALDRYHATPGFRQDALIGR